MTSFNFRTLSRLRFLSFASRYFKIYKHELKKSRVTVVIISIHFPLFIISFIFSHSVPANLFQKLLLHIFQKRRRLGFNRFVCSRQGGYLVSIETEEEWQFISNEIQKRVTWNTSAWHIGLQEIDKVWTWLSGERLNISKWRNFKPGGNYKKAEISKNGGLFMLFLGMMKINTFARCPEVRSHSNYKIY